MHNTVKVLFLQLIYLLVLPTIESTNEKDLGCVLLPTKIGKHMEQSELLSSLNHYKLFGEKYTFSSDVKTDVKYEFTICGDADSKKPQASVIRRSVDEGRVEAIGMRNSTSLSGVKGDWIYMKLGAGDKDTSGGCINTSLTSSVMIKCDRDYSTPQFSLVYEELSYCHFLFELKAAAICEGSPGLGGWTIFFIIVIVGFAAYFIAGLIYLRFVAGAQGINQIPHRQFWRKVGNKIADCCNVCRCNQCCDENDLEDHSPYSSGYSPIGESPNFPSNSSAAQKDSPLLHP